MQRLFCLLRRVRSAEYTRTSGAAALSGGSAIAVLLAHSTHHREGGEAVRVFGRKDYLRVVPADGKSMPTQPDIRNPGLPVWPPAMPEPCRRQALAFRS